MDYYLPDIIMYSDYVVGSAFGRPIAHTYVEACERRSNKEDR